MAAPFRLDGPSFLIGATDPPTIELAGNGRRVTIVPAQEFEDVETFSNPGGEAPGLIRNTISLEVLQSFGADGLWNVLKPLEGTLVYFQFLLDGDSPEGVGNPMMTGQCYVPAVPFIDAGVRKFSTFTLEFKVSGVPVFDTTAPV